jgi:hypothetical protein
MTEPKSDQGEPYPDDNPKTKFGVRKPQLHAIPASSLLLLGQVMQLGEAKYGLTNWRHKTVSSSVYYDAAMRHLLSWLDGENADPESGVSHLAHVMACCAILLDAETVGNLNDDRPAIGAAGRLIQQLKVEG